MAEPMELKTHQYAFAAHIRDPENAPAPTDVEDRRMAIYRDLFFNNVRSLLAGTFPILSEILGPERWTQLVRDFYRDHQSHSPLFPDVPREFLHYLNTERSDGQHTDPLPDLPFMNDLAHYEWVEAGLLLAEDPQADASLDPSGDLLEGAPAVSELAWLLRYDWPVHEIGIDSQPEEPLEQPLYFLVYRNADDKVKFTRLNAVSARLLEILQTNPGIKGCAALTQLASEMQHPDPEQVTRSGAAILEQWRELGVIQGAISD